MRKTILNIVTVVAIVTLLAPGASAQSNMTAFGELGFAKLMEDGAPGGSIGFGGGIIYPLPNRPFAVGGEVAYLLLGSESNIDFSEIQITGQGYYMFPEQPSMQPYLEAGAGFYNSRSSGEIEIPGLPSVDVDESETDLGINFGGGIKFGKADSKVKFGADGKWHVIFADDSANMITLMARAFFDL